MLFPPLLNLNSDPATLNIINQHIIKKFQGETLTIHDLVFPIGIFGSSEIVGGWWDI